MPRAALLKEIVRSKQREVAVAKQRLPLGELEARVAHHTEERRVRQALHLPGKLALIAELKRKSPSRGMLRERFDPVSLAQSLQEAGAAALSVLTDEPYFGGHLDFLRDVKQFTEVPVLRKDFIVDPYQVYESALYGADAILLIVRLLPPTQLRQSLETARAIGLESLVEVHSAEELDVALEVGAQVIGINHRDLDTLEVNPHLCETLVPRIPNDRVIVAESGIHTAEEVARMRQLGVHALLIGEALMMAPDPAQKVRELFAGVW